MYICTHVDIYISIYIVIVQWIYIYIRIHGYVSTYNIPLCKSNGYESIRRAGGRVIRLDRRSDIVGRVWLSSSGPGVNGLVGRGSSLR